MTTIPKGDRAWITLDADDNTPSTFWSDVDARLQLLSREARAGFNTRHEWNDAFLVLDDAHVLTTGEARHNLASLVGLIPPWMHLVIACRGQVPIPLWRMRTAGELVEIDDADLRLDADEAAADRHGTDRRRLRLRRRLRRAARVHRRVGHRPQADDRGPAFERRSPGRGAGVLPGRGPRPPTPRGAALPHGDVRAGKTHARTVRARHRPYGRRRSAARARAGQPVRRAPAGALRHLPDPRPVPFGVARRAGRAPSRAGGVDSRRRGALVRGPWRRGRGGRALARGGPRDRRGATAARRAHDRSRRRPRRGRSGRCSCASIRRWARRTCGGSSTTRPRSARWNRMRRWPRCSTRSTRSSSAHPTTPPRSEPHSSADCCTSRIGDVEAHGQLARTRAGHPRHGPQPRARFPSRRRAPRAGAAVSGWGTATAGWNSPAPRTLPWRAPRRARLDRRDIHFRDSARAAVAFRAAG